MLTDSDIEKAIKKFKDKVLDGYREHRDTGKDDADAMMLGAGKYYHTGFMGQPDLRQLRQYADDRTDPDFVELEQRYQGLIDYKQEQVKHLTRYGKFDGSDDSALSQADIYYAALDSGLDMELPPKEYTDPNDDARLQRPPADFVRWAKAYLNAEVEIFKTEIARLSGVDTDYDRNRRAELARPNKLLSEAAEEFLTARKTSTQKNTLSRVRQRLNIWLRLLADKPMRDFTEAELTEAGDLILEWPAKAQSRKDLDHLSAADILKRKDLGAPLALGTVDTMRSTLRSLFKHAVAKNWADKNLCPMWPKLVETKDDKIDDDGVQKELNTYEHWTDGEILRLLQTSYYVKPEHKSKTPENYWLPLLGLFVGGRLEELCQLYTDDILVDQRGYHVIRIHRNDERKQTTKNRNSVRVVPVHQTLIDLGFLRYRDWIAKQSIDVGQLFPHIEYVISRTNENYSANYSQRFGTHTKRHMTWDTERKVFHGFRCSFIRTLRYRNGLHFEDIKYLVGHAPQHKMGDLYAGRQPADVRYEHLQRLDYGIDFVGLLGRWTAPAAVKSKVKKAKIKE